MQTDTSLGMCQNWWESLQTDRYTGFTRTLCGFCSLTCCFPWRSTVSCSAPTHLLRQLPLAAQAAQKTQWDQICHPLLWLCNVSPKPHPHNTLFTVQSWTEVPGIVSQYCNVCIIMPCFDICLSVSRTGSYKTANSESWVVNNALFLFFVSFDAIVLSRQSWFCRTQFPAEKLWTQ